MVRFLFLTLLTVMSMAQMGQAQSIEETMKADFRLTMPQMRVTQIIDGQTFMVNRDKIIHIPAIYIPWETQQSQGKYALQAKEFLEETILNNVIRIYQVRQNERALFNALGHHEGYPITEDGVLLQIAMVENGLAFAYPSQSHYHLAERLYEAEAEARDNKVGLWAEDQWQVYNPQSIKGIENRFVVVEGQIEKVASRNNIIYLNFEQDWRTDFTVAFDSLLRREFSRAVIDVMNLAGAKIRVRGWVRDYNGPFIEIFHPSQIEILEE